MKTFAVGCLPRSGSAWLATALNACTPMVVCHEIYGKAACKALSHPRGWWGTVGSDTLLPSSAQYFDSDQKLYFLWRRPEEVEASLKAMGVYTYDVHETNKLWVQKFLDEHNPVMLSFNNLPSAIRTIAHDMNVEVNEAVLAQMLQMRITSKIYGDSQ